MSGREWCTLEEWLQCRRPLCPMVVRHDGRIEPSNSNNAQQQQHQPGLRVVFANRRIGGAFLTDGATQECAAFSSHPELLSVLPYVESLEDNEALTASGLCTYSIIHDLKNKAVSDPAPAAADDANRKLQESAMCLLDAEDYSDLPVRQYEEDNVLRELNKAYLGFRQPIPMSAAAAAAAAAAPPASSGTIEERLPPVGASRDSSPSRKLQAGGLPIVTDDEDNSNSSKLDRTTTMVPADADQRRSSNPTLLYGGGRNAPLTLTNATATVVNKLDPDITLLRPPPMIVEAKKSGGSVYASCDSQHDGSVEEFRSAHTSLDEDDKAPSAPSNGDDVQGGINNGGDEDPHPRAHSLESDSSSENRRPGSRGFALDGQGLCFEDDSFSGDGLERERKWLEHFRERRGTPRRENRGGGLKDSSNSSSSKDSSRYSFSTEFSSELDELYDQFSHWLEDPNNDQAGKNGRNAAVFRFAHGLLKRTLSDSFASVALNIENLSSMKDVCKQRSKGGPKQRSWSLADHVADERLALQLAKEIVEQGVLEEEALPMPDLVPVEAVQHQSSSNVVHQPEPKKKMASSEPRAIAYPAPERVKVRLLDRMSPVNDLTQTDLCSTTKSQSSCAGEDSDTQASNFTPTTTPMNPTPPRTRRGSWIFKKSREQRHPQRARSNSVPTVMELTQLTLWQQQLAERASCHIPDIIVSGENSEEEDECFNSASAAIAPVGRRPQYRSLEDRLQRLAQSNESLLSDDVVEGFSWTMAETIIEDIMKEIGSKQSNLSVRSGNGRPGNPPPGSKRKMPCKGILKLSSNDSLNRSHSGSLDRPDGCPPSPSVRIVTAGGGGGGGGGSGGISGGGNGSSGNDQTGGDRGGDNSQPMSWSQRSTSMPSLRAIDELESLSPTSSFHVATGGDSNGGSQDPEKKNGHHALPIITGNWGCGSSSSGDAQLKSMLQWMAASRAGAPCLIYYTAGSSSVVKLDIVCRVIADRQWTVGDLAGAVLRYCRIRLDPRRLDLIAAAAAAAATSSTGHPDDAHLDSHLLPAPADRLLFDELLGPLKQTEL